MTFVLTSSRATSSVRTSTMCVEMLWIPFILLNQICGQSQDVSKKKIKKLSSDLFYFCFVLFVCFFKFYCLLVFIDLFVACVCKWVSYLISSVSFSVYVNYILF